MAASGYTPISLYYSTTAAAVPVNTNLVNGELAINITDGKLYYKDNAGVVQVLATKGSAVVAGADRQIQFNNAGSLGAAANFSYDAGGNLLLGTATSPASGAGTLTVAGYGVINYTGANGAASTVISPLLAQNATVYASTGATTEVLMGLQSAPQQSNTGAGGSNVAQVRGINTTPQITASGAAANVAIYGVGINATRTYSTDLSSNASNQVLGISLAFGHAATLSSTASSNLVYGINASGTFSAGSATTYAGFAVNNSAAPTSGTVALTNLVGFLHQGPSIGTGAGTATVTNYYGLQLGAPTVGGNGTITNRYGVYQADTVGTNYFGANTLIGTTVAPTTTTTAGSASIAGMGLYGYAAANGVTNTSTQSGLLLQNANINSTGAAAISLSSVIAEPQASHDATSGTATLTLRGLVSGPQITSSAATSVLTLQAVNFNATRSYSTDTSTSASNGVTSAVVNFGHGATLPTTAFTNNATGISVVGTMNAGSVTNYVAYQANIPVIPTAGTVSVTNAYGFYGAVSNIGTSTGTANITNFYGLYLAAPTVGGNGTITNRYGIYQADTVGSNYFGAATNLASNLNFVGTAQRITGDFSGTLANRVHVQSSTTNGFTSFSLIPNGTNTQVQYNLETDSALANGSTGQIALLATEFKISTGLRGTGAYVPMTFTTGGSERLRLDTSGNLLLGTTTSPTSGSGSLTVGGIANINFTGANNTSTTTVYSGQLSQNTNYNFTGSAALSAYHVVSAPQVSNDGTGGTNAINIRAFYGYPQLTSTGANAQINLMGSSFNATRSWAADISSNTGNAVQSVVASFGHASTLPSSAFSSGVYGVNATGAVNSGSVGSYYGYQSTLSSAPTSGTVTITDIAGFINNPGSIGTGAGTVTVTNHYGLILNSPTVGGNGTITNRYGVFQTDTLARNIFSGTVRISSGYTVATLPTGVGAGTRAYVTDALAPTWGTALVGGGAVTVPAFYNGTTWIAA